MARLMMRLSSKSVTLVLLLLFLQEQVPECLRLKEDGIIEDAAAVWIKEMKNSHFYDRVGV